jgi:hypothetical protein
MPQRHLTLSADTADVGLDAGEGRKKQGFTQPSKCALLRASRCSQRLLDTVVDLVGWNEIQQLWTDFEEEICNAMADVWVDPPPGQSATLMSPSALRP